MLLVGVFRPLQMHNLRTMRPGGGGGEGGALPTPLRPPKLPPKLPARRPPLPINNADASGSGSGPARQITYVIC